MNDGTDPLDDIKALRLDPAATPRVPARIKKRRKEFVKLPMSWMEKLGEVPLATGATHQVAWHLLYLDWKNRSKPFKLSNGILEYGGISRFSKWRALADLERRGLIMVERRRRKSPIVHVLQAAP